FWISSIGSLRKPGDRDRLPVSLSPFYHEVVQVISYTALQSEHDQQDDDAEHEILVLGVSTYEVLDQFQQEGAEQRPEEQFCAAEHKCEDRITRSGPESKFRIGAGDEERQDYAADTRHRAR